MKTFDDFLDTSKALLDILDVSKELSTFEISSEFLADSNVYIPFVTGDLKRSSINFSDFEKGLLVWQTPYARRLFYNPQFDFSKDANPNARGLWAEYAKEQNQKKYRRLANKSFDKAKKEVL